MPFPAAPSLYPRMKGMKLMSREDIMKEGERIYDKIQMGFTNNSIRNCSDFGNYALLK
jgi:hypothetical protein